jgi:hypothetical protein
MMRNRVMLILTSVLVAMSLTGQASALPGSGVVPGWDPDTVLFDYTYDGRNIAGQIDYAVYEDFPGWLPGAGPYVYAYEIYNSEFSNVSIDSFSVAMFDGVDGGLIGFDVTGSPTGIEPSFNYFSPDAGSPQSAVFLFLPHQGGVIEDGYESVTLLFSSDDAPTAGFGIIEGGGIGTMVDGIATPLPEPTTILLLGMGGAAVTMMRRKC